RKGFDTVVILVAWSIWKERNNRVFKHRQRSWREVAKDAVDECCAPPPPPPGRSFK
ncbi:Os01g0137550, partial [Oryza sativa Japonica Group]